MYHYEFTDLEKLSNIFYKVSLPKVKNGYWRKSIEYYFIQKLSLQIFVNDLLIDKKIIEPYMLEILNENKTSINPYPMSSDYPSTIYIPLLHETIRKSIDYINGCPPDISYKIICDVTTIPHDKLNCLYTFFNTCVALTP